MNKRNLLIVICLVIVIVLVFLLKKNPDTVSNNQNATTTSQVVKKTISTNTQTNTNSPSLTKTSAPSIGFPEIEFIDKKINLPLKNYSSVVISIDQIVFGRGNSVISPGCSGGPSSNYSTYFYPVAGTCITSDPVDGSPRALLAINAIIQNNGPANFGGIADVVKLHYLRATSDGKPVHKFAYPISSLATYTISPYSSKQVILSFLVPEDEQVFDLLINYSGELSPDVSKDVYQSSIQGLFINFKTKSVTIVK
jgi:hypothetical protein